VNLTREPGPPATCADLGLDHRLRADLPDGLTPARVVAVHRGGYTVLGDGPPRLVTLAGRLRHGAQSPSERPAVGDWVALDRAGGMVIQSIAPRRGIVARTDPQTGNRQVIAAHVDTAFVVTSANRDLNQERLQRFVALATSGGVDPVVLLNKTDLAVDVDAALATVREAVGGTVPVLAISALAGVGLEAVTSALGARRTAVLLGTSGVGKSTLINALLGSSRQATATIRASDDRGRHTTVHRELFTLPDGGLLIDTPGLKLVHMPAEHDVGSGDEITALARDCRFVDCRHETEPDCAVQAAIADGRLNPARLAAARKMSSEAAWAEARSDPVDRRAREREWRRMIRVEQQDKDTW
jgi:ribosome biogenesis GTPase